MNINDPIYKNPDYLDYLDKCRRICNKIYIARNISLDDAAIIDQLKQIDKLNSHKCWDDDKGN